jgi:hypothetical protein
LAAVYNAGTARTIRAAYEGNTCDTRAELEIQ